MAKLRGIGIRMKLLWLLTLLLVAVVGFYSTFTYKIKKQDFYITIDSRLKDAVHAGARIMGDDFHNKVMDKNISYDDFYDKTVVTTKFVRDIGVEYIYSKVLVDDKLHYTVSTLDENETKKEDAKPYYGVYTEDGMPPQAQLKCVYEQKIVFDEYKDDFGQHRSMFLPFTTKDGLKGFIGADISIAYIEEELSGLLMKSVGYGLGIFAIVMTLIFANLNPIVRAIEKLAESSKKVQKGDLSVRSDINRKDELGLLSESFNSMVAQLQESVYTLESKVQERTKELSHANERIMDSIFYAKRIQSSFLPTDDEIRHICKDYFVLANPKDIVGGDFYWMGEYRGGYFIAAIDCTGHGVPGAFMTLIVSSLLEKTLVEHNSESPALLIESASLSKLEKEITEHNSVSPAFILSKLNKEIKIALRQDTPDGESNDGCDGGLIFVDPKNKKIRFAGANTSLFMIDPKGELSVINSDKHSLGYRHSDINYKFTDHEFDLVENTSFYITTDGITDQIGGDKKLSFGKKRLSRTLLKYKDLPMSEQKEALCKEFDAYKLNEVQRDDNTMVGLRI